MMVIQSIELVISAAHKKQIPMDGRPQLVLAGRSNVGKSSFINAMLNNKKVARVSATPGKTRLLNFFLINQAFYFVDVPGYGYAAVDHATQEAFAPLLEGYFQSVRPMAGILILDVRRTPSKDDLTMLSFYRTYRIPVVAIATKCDKVSNNVRTNQFKEIREALALRDEEALLPFSALSKQGVDAVWAHLETILSA
jgi:GTP-binding protein